MGGVLGVQPPDQEGLVDAEHGDAVRWSLGAKSRAATDIGTTSGRSTWQVSPSCTIVADPLATHVLQPISPRP